MPIDPEYFNNNIAVEGEIIVKTVPNNSGTVLVWNPATKKLSTRTNAEIISDLNINHRAFNVNNWLGADYVGGGNEKPNSPYFGSGKLKLQMLNGSNLGIPSGVWQDVLWLSAYNKPDVKLSTAIISSKYNNEIGFTKQDYDSPNWGTYYKFWTSENFNPANYVTTSQLSNYATQTWTNTNFIPKSHPVYNVTQANINTWNKSHVVDNTSLLNNASNTHYNQSWFDYNWAGLGQLGLVINFAGLNNLYNAEIFAEYSGGNTLKFRTKNGDTNTWNPAKNIYHSGNLLGVREIVIDDGAIRLKPLEVNFGAGNHAFSDRSKLIRVICN